MDSEGQPVGAAPESAGIVREAVGAVREAAGAVPESDDFAPRVTFYFARHGQTEHNLAHLAQGWCDAPLTELGVADACRLGRGLAHEGVAFRALVSSDLGRAQSTLEHAMRAYAAEPAAPPVPGWCETDARVREWCYGDLEGRPGTLMRAVFDEAFGEGTSFEELNRRLPETANALWRADDSGRAQSWDDIAARLQSFLHDFALRAAAAGGGNVLVVTHSFAIRAIMYLLDPSRVNDPVKLENASVALVHWDGGSFTLGRTGIVFA